VVLRIGWQGKGSGNLLARVSWPGEARRPDADAPAARNEQITSEQAAALPQPLAAALGRLVGEYEGRTSREAECARDADKLDMLLQALEYREAGWRNLDPFIQTAVTALRTPSGRRLGEAAMVVSPAAWWQGFARGVPKISPGSLNGG
jgi:5'-deoxynucleotidase YfbR-like HD superfamily hydrolase